MDVPSVWNAKHTSTAAMKKNSATGRNGHVNECLCGLVVKPSSEGSLLCKKKGCKTQWVREFLIRYVTLLTLIFSTIYNVYLWSRHLDIGFAQPVVSLCKDKGGSASEDDVILLYLDLCLIT